MRDGRRQAGCRHGVNTLRGSLVICIKERLGRLTLLVDDRSQQPRESLVPVVRTELLRRYGARLTRPLEAVSVSLTTGDLVRLNHITAVNPLGPAEAVDAYLRRFGG
jgi:glycine betaine/choline ABC-type transport system substrate-binding protein